MPGAGRGPWHYIVALSPTLALEISPQGLQLLVRIIAEAEEKHTWLKCLKAY